VTEDEWRDHDIRLREAKPPKDAFKSSIERLTLSIGVAAAAVTLIVQVGSYFTERQATATAKAQSSNEWDFRAVELFVKEQDKLTSCDADNNARHLKLFTDLFSQRITGAIRQVGEGQVATCLAQATGKGQQQAQDEKLNPDQQAKAAETARTLALIQQAPLLDAATSGSATAYTVFIQIPDEDRRVEGNDLQRALAGTGYSAPGVERVKVAPRQPEVRFYREAQRGDAQKLAGQIQQLLKLPAPPAVRLLGGDRKGLPARVMEFWFPAR
jgi:hypothetical protein